MTRGKNAANPIGIHCLRVQSAHRHHVLSLGGRQYREISVALQTELVVLAQPVTLRIIWHNFLRAIWHNRPTLPTQWTYTSGAA